ncbi:MAG TPA: 4'-phosphopantetheinyl transferase superfamily protein [Hyphomicrobiaceae bacterium]|nr:4'-phosphopantetheinyl transferase superfamily protein [Hyphomicrobiaceae bacterium]
MPDPAGQNGAELWLVDLARAGPALERLEHEVPRLGALDRGRMLALPDARRRLAAHVALRVIIEARLGAGLRGREVLRRGGGKPRLEAQPDGIDFSLSYTDHLALIGLARGSAIGVDIERVRPVAIAPQRRRNIETAAAALLHQACAEGPADRAFMQAWVRLEALAKARGEGLAAVLVRLGIRHAQLPPAAAVSGRARRHLAATGLKVEDLAPAPDCVAAVAADRTLTVPAIMGFPCDRPGIEALLGARAC